MVEEVPEEVFEAGPRVEVQWASRRDMARLTAN
jgi:hypothetical protein